MRLLSFIVPEAVSEFYSGGCQMASEASRKFLAPPCEFLAPPCRGVPIFTGGCQPLIHKYINRGLTYGLLIVIYHLL